MPEKAPRLAVVVPVYGNAGSLEALHERIDRAVAGLGVELTLQFVNDRSPDDSQAVIERLVRKDPRVRGLLLSKNHGSFLAILAGLTEVSDHDAVVIMSADLQDPPEKIPEMVASWRSGFPVVLCVRRNRADPLMTVLFSKLYNLIFRAMAMKEMPVGGFDLCLLSRQALDVVLASADKNTSLPGLIIWTGFERGYVIYDRAERVHGKSMWSMRKKVEHAINSVISFSNTPLRFFAGLGVLLSLASMAGMGFVLWNYATGRVTLTGWTSLVMLMLIIASFQFLAVGVLGEYLWYFLEKSTGRPAFVVEKRLGGAAASVPATTGSAADGVPFFALDAVFGDAPRALAAAAERIMARRQVILGEEVSGFEREFAAAAGAAHAVGVANGTDALTLALWASGVGPGDAVITTALSAPATVVAILRAGAVPHIVDVSPDTLTIDPAAVEKTLRSGVKAKALLPVHLYGNPCDMERLSRLAAEHGLAVVEDCAQSFGARAGAKPCGSYSKAAAFSFYPTKNLGAYGDGGAVTTDDAALAAELRRMRFYGQDAAGECVTRGMNSRLDELQAGLLRERLARAADDNRARAAVVEAYDRELGFLRPVPSRPGRAPHLYVVRPSDREAFRRHLSAGGVQTGAHYPLALSRHRHFREHAVTAGCPVAEAACASVTSLPLYPGMTGAQVARVIEACKAWSAKAPVRSGA